MRAVIGRVVNSGESFMAVCRALAVGMVATLVLGPGIADACSVCGGFAMGTDPGAGFNWSILFLLGMPYAVVGAIAGWLVYTHRRTFGPRESNRARPRLAWTQKESEN